MSKTTKFFLLRANKNNEYYEDGAVAILVAIDADTKKTISDLSDKIMGLKEINHHIHKLNLFDYTPIGIPSGVIDEDDEYIYDRLLENESPYIEKDFVEITEKEYNHILTHVEASDKSVNLDVVTMELDGNNVKWEGYYKHSNTMFDTGNIPIKNILK